MDPRDFMAELYRSLLRQGWTMPEIDGMDVIYYLYLLRKESEAHDYIDDVL